MTPFQWVAAAAVLALLLGLVLVAGGRRLRRRFGLGEGRTVALDNVTLVSRRYRLGCRMDRLIRTGGQLVPEEWKSTPVVRPWHMVQIGVDFLLIEEKMRVRPTHGFIVTGDHKWHRIENTPELRAWVLEVHGQMRAATAKVPIAVNPRPGQCPPCGMLEHCGQARL